MLDGERSGKHLIAAAAGTETFVSSELLHADKFHHIFTKAGTYELTCPLHPYMKSRISVYQPGIHP